MTTHKTDDALYEAEQQILSKAVAERLRASSAQICASGTMTPRALASAMIGVGLELTISSFGDLGAVDWLRGIADEIEQGGQNNPITVM